MLKLYLDDIRIPKDSSFEIVRSYKEAVAFVKERGAPDYISFDHDLGIEPGVIEKTGYDFAKWLVEADMNKEIDIPIHFRFNVHSANPIGAKNIESYLKNYLKRKFYD